MAYAPLGLGSMPRRHYAFTWKVLTSAVEAWLMKLLVQVVQQLCSKHWKSMGFKECFLKLKEQSESEQHIPDPCLNGMAQGSQRSGPERAILGASRGLQDPPFLLVLFDSGAIFLSFPCYKLTGREQLHA